MRIAQHILQLLRRSCRDGCAKEHGYGLASAVSATATRCCPCRRPRMRLARSALGSRFSAHSRDPAANLGESGRSASCDSSAGSRSPLGSSAAGVFSTTHSHLTGRKWHACNGSISASGREPHDRHIAPIPVVSVSFVMSSSRLQVQPATTGPLHFSHGKAMR